ncbi:MAG: sugar phosphate isomerase/epimerase family protein [bacterium]
MKFAYQIQTWGGVVGHPAGVGCVKELYYLSNISLLDQPLTEISRAGYQGFEAFDGDVIPFVERKTEFVNLCREKNLDFVAVYCGANFIFREILKEELHKIEKVANFAKVVGCRILVVGGGAIRHDGIKENDYENLAESLSRVAEIADDAGLECCYHPHLGTICENKKQLAKLMTLTDINLCPDTAHLAAGGSDPPEVIRSYADRINYVHLKDYKDGKWLELGEGEIDFPAIIGALRKAQYDGWITVELDVTERTPLESAVISKKYIDSHLR